MTDTATYVEVIAKVESTMLGWEDHGILTCWLHVSYGGSAQGIGGYALDASAGGDDRRRYGTAYGMEFVRRVMLAAGVGQWEHLKGRTLYVLREDDGWNARIVGLAPLPTERGERFIFDELRGYADPLRRMEGT